MSKWVFRLLGLILRGSQDQGSTDRSACFHLVSSHQSTRSISTSRFNLSLNRLPSWFVLTVNWPQDFCLWDFRQQRPLCSAPVSSDQEWLPLLLPTSFCQLRFVEHTVCLILSQKANLLLSANVSSQASVNNPWLSKIPTSLISQIHAAAALC